MEDEYRVMIPVSLASRFLEKTNFFCAFSEKDKLMQQVSKRILEAKAQKQREQLGEK